MFAALGKSIGCEVTVAGRGANRLRKAAALGADCVLDVSHHCGLTAGMKASGLSPFDVVIEAVGKVETWEAAVQGPRRSAKGVA